MRHTRPAQVQDILVMQLSTHLIEIKIKLPASKSYPIRIPSVHLGQKFMELLLVYTRQDIDLSIFIVYCILLIYIHIYTYT